MIVGSLSAMSVHVMGGGNRNYPARKLVGAVHGAGLLFVLVAGFGLLARLGLVQGMPTWVIVKLVIWLILGGIPALIYRKAKFAKLFWLCTFLFAGAAAYLGVYKPF
ncbi:MAG TPA: hypothetical protein VM432_01900 [Bdellovibrionales bacterium]|nr:hypothetical protein [Bdellovibrionales bacterium]